MTILIYILGLLAILYSAVLLRLLSGLNRIPAPESTDRPFVSVIVAARNEEDNIAGLLGCLLSLDYPRDNYEIIIIDDGTPKLPVEFQVIIIGKSAMHRCDHKDHRQDNNYKVFTHDTSFQIKVILFFHSNKTHITQTKLMPGLT